MANLKGVLKCTQEQYNRLLAGETLTIGGKTYTYDENVLYVTDDNSVTEQQTYEQTEADNAVIIRNGNIVKQMATFTVTGNSEKIWSFPYSYDTGKKPMVWVNSVAEGNNANNGAAVIGWNETSMTVRSCGIDSQITFYAEGWITKE